MASAGAPSGAGFGVGEQLGKMQWYSQHICAVMTCLCEAHSQTPGLPLLGGHPHCEGPWRACELRPRSWVALTRPLFQDAEKTVSRALPSTPRNHMHLGPDNKPDTQVQHSTFVAFIFFTLVKP